MQLNGIMFRKTSLINKNVLLIVTDFSHTNKHICQIVHKFYKKHKTFHGFCLQNNCDQLVATDEKTTGT